MRAVTAAQMREAEQAAVAKGISLDTLMENAGLAVANAVSKWLWHRTRGEDYDRPAAGKHITVLVGPGNNGGDGLVAARHLAMAGAHVRCFVLLPRASTDPNRERAERAGVRVVEAARSRFTEKVSALHEAGLVVDLADSLHEADVIIDAVLGTGQNRPIAEPLASALRAARQSGKPVIAVDLPTGVNSDSGSFDPNGLPAEVTLMLGLPKIGPIANPPGSRSGHIDVLDIGLPLDTEGDDKVEWLPRELAASLLPSRIPGGHKGTFGRVLIVAGSRNYIGAGLLAAQGALRSGAGLVELALPQSVYDIAAGRIAEAIYLPLAERSPGELDPVVAGQQALKAVREATVVLIGPGLGQSGATAEVVNAFMAWKPESVPTVLDADALNILAAGYRWWERIRGPAVLTPHPGEMARLLGTSVASVQRDRLGAATAAAAKWGKVVVLKGAGTIIASPDGTAAVSPWVNSGLAKGGTGDVLAGLLTGLLAQRPSDLSGMARLAVCLHGLAGEHAENDATEFGMTAGDLVNHALPDVLDDLVPDGARPLPTGWLSPDE